MLQRYNSYIIPGNLLLIGILFSTVLQAQIKPNTVVQTPNATGTQTVYLPGPYITGTLVNYVRSWQPQQPFSLESDVSSTSRTAAEVSKATQYFDGLGRPLQTVSWQASPGNKDIIAPTVYDDYGREQYKFLPYTSTGNTGAFAMDPFGAQKSFYSTTYKTEQPALANEKFYYSQTDFEASPLNRVTASFAPGNDWVGSKGAATERSVKMQYMVNTTADAVKIWQIGFDPVIADNTNIPTLPAPPNSDSYGDGQLYKTVTLDERGNAVVEYKDKEGKVVLKKVKISAIASDYSGTTGFLCTYYVYDDLGQLRFVMPPKAVASLINNGWVLSQTVVDELCFRYEYDERQRMIAKKVPGADWVYMVYDNRDRLVFTQDGNMRSKSPQQWLYTLYDDLNRPMQTGIMAYTGTWASLESYVNSVTAGTSTVAATGTYIQTNPADLYINNRDYGRVGYTATNSVTFDEGFASEDNASFTAEIVTEAASTFNTNTTVALSPIPTSGATIYPLTYTFYDDYTWTGKTYSSSNNSKLDGGNNAAATLETLPSQNSIHTKGAATGTRTRVIEDPDNLSLGKWMEAVSFYDEDGRTIQVQSDNYKGGKDVVTSRYNFAGKAVCTYLVHNNPAGSISNFSVKTNMDYDHVGRLLKVNKQLNEDATTLRTIVQNQYDALGQLKNKKTGQKSVTDATPLEDDNYSYNIRGWLKGINWYSGGGTYASQVSSSSAKWFGMDLSYSWGFDNSSAQFNGNISGMRWQTAGDEKERAYGFKYDAANRLLKADFTQNNSGWATDPVIDFSMQVGDGSSYNTAYDDNGNIKAMLQKGVQGAQKITVDDLTYSYNTTSNKLSKVTDAILTDTKMGDFSDKNTGPDYGYDVNGNLITDKNKKLNGNTGIDQVNGAIKYNHLNLPWSIAAKNDDNTDKGTITYIYDAVGNKLEKRINEVASTYNNNKAKQTTTTYLSGFVYENNKLQFLAQEEGRIRYKQSIDAVTEQPKTEYVYDYFLKDHLGNVRMVLTDEQQSDMYPPLTFEDAGKAEQDAIWDNSAGQSIDVANSRVTRPGAFGTSTTNGSYVKSVTKNTGAIGATKMLKVMSGDRLDVAVDYYYAANMTSTNANGLNTFLSSIIGIITNSDGVASGIKGDATNIQTNLTNNPDVTGVFANQNASGVTATPKAYLHVLLFDERFVYDNVNSFVQQVGAGYTAGDQLGNITRVNGTGINVKKNGYAYIYFSNESDGLVYFDNFMLTHVRGPLLEETHYYPFGLTMAGISSKAAGSKEANKKFQGQEFAHGEFSNGTGLEMYEFKYRMADPQTGRFWSIDPLAEKYVYNSTYAFSENKVTSHVEIEGLEAQSINTPGTVGLSIPKNTPMFQSTLNQSLKGANLPAQQAAVVSNTITNEYNKNSILSPNNGVSTVVTGTNMPSPNVPNNDGTYSTTTYAVTFKAEVMATDLQKVGYGGFSQSQLQQTSLSDSKTITAGTQLSYKIGDNFTVQVSGSISYATTVTNSSGLTNTVTPVTTQYQGNEVFSITTIVTATTTTYTPMYTYEPVTGTAQVTSVPISTTSSTTTSTVTSVPDPNVKVSTWRQGKF